jgi:hypothetical protein
MLLNITDIRIWLETEKSLEDNALLHRASIKEVFVRKIVLHKTGRTIQLCIAIFLARGSDKQ